MPQDGFLRRWSRLKAQGGAPQAPQDVRHLHAVAELPALAQTAPHPAVAPRPPAEPERPLPTLEDVARLDTNSDFSAFVSQGVDKAVQRLAMKKLFSDPHFNTLDGLDIYIDDYTRHDPVSAAMLASLQHAKSLFAPRNKDEREADAAPAGQVAGDVPAPGAAPAGAPPADTPPDHPDTPAPGLAGEPPGGTPAPGAGNATPGDNRSPPPPSQDA
jgi:hypothetical protein